uniref:Uncharacterized protein n=1 Tax=Anguilla anguilla TaxID=7936 RepID=A0A0E9SCJ1_ANGAN
MSNGNIMNEYIYEINVLKTVKYAN